MEPLKLQKNSSKAVGSHYLKWWKWRFPGQLEGHFPIEELGEKSIINKIKRVQNEDVQQKQNKHERIQ